MDHFYKIAGLLLLACLCLTIWRLGDRIPQPVTEEQLDLALASKDWRLYEHARKSVPLITVANTDPIDISIQAPLNVSVTGDIEATCSTSTQPLNVAVKNDP
jgi:hypothetical protein